MHFHLTTIVALTIFGCCIATATNTTYNHYRLPTAIQPDLYQLKIITHLEDPNNLTYYGHVSIRFNVLEDTSNITLHVRNLTIDEKRTTLKSYNDENFSRCYKGVETVPEHDYYIIKLCESLKKDQIYKLKLYFSAPLNEEVLGYYRSSYVIEETKERRWLSVTQFEPAFAREAFPCLDEPNYKAKFIIWLGHHKSLTALSNMPLKKQIPLNGTDDFVWSIFDESVAMSTYLVAFTVNDFGYKASNHVEGTDVIFRTWYRKDALDQCDYAAELAPHVLKYYEDIFGVSFPLPKVDSIVIPDFAKGGMENWGLITYSETALLFSPNVSSEDSKRRITNVIYHELAHQWFGNLVTMKWWSDLWLNEGFPTYVAILGVQSLNPEWDSYNTDCLQNMQNIFSSDASLNSHPISQEIMKASDIEKNFDAIAYNKGAGVLRMVHRVLGDNGFFEGVRDYLQKYQYKNAEQDDLWAVFNEKALKYGYIDNEHDMKTILDSWTLQTGFPLVKINRNYDTDLIEITQQRYLDTVELPAEEAKKCWWIPLSFTTASEMNFTSTTPRSWLECDDTGRSVLLQLKNVVKPEDWIIFNIQFSGIFRIMYDSENWQLLRNTLNSDQYSSIHVMNRAQLVDDTIALAWSGHHGYDVMFDVLDYFIREQDYLPWNTALKGLSAINILLKPFKDHYAYFKAYMSQIIKPIYKHLGGLNETVNPTTTTHNHILHKSLITKWACNLDQDDCVQAAIDNYQKWKTSEDPSTDNNIPVNLRSIVYCTAIRHGDEDDWQFLWERYLETNEVSVKVDTLIVLGCSRSTEILRKYVNMTFDTEADYVPKQYAMIPLISLFMNDVGIGLAKDYFQEHIEDIYDYLGPYASRMSMFADAVATFLVSAEELQTFTDLMQKHKDLFPNSENGIQKAFEKAESNIKWVERNFDNIKVLLESRLHAMGVKTN